MFAVIENQPFHEYQATAGLNNSTLWPLISQSPAHAKAILDAGPTDPTPALVLGSAIHAAVLEPGEFAEAYVEAPECDRRTTIGKNIWAGFVRANPGKTILTTAQMETAIACRDSVWEHPTAGAILRGKTTDGFEASVYWEETVGDLTIPMKGRVDVPSRPELFGGELILGDLKSTQDASPRAFANSVAKYGYGLQTHIYRRGWSAVTKEIPVAWYWIAVEKTPPYAVAVYECGGSTLERAAAAYDRGLKTWGECVESGVWPAYDADPQLLDAPPWAPGLLMADDEGLPALALDAFS